MLHRSLILWLVLLTAGCTRLHWMATFGQPNEMEELDEEHPFLKVHMQDGSVYVLGGWEIDPETRVISGQGILYDARREEVERGPTSIDPNGVLLLETNAPERVVVGGYAVLGVITGASLAVTGFCIVNPKACFGSCPTFYAQGEQGFELQAEGFSRSVARVLEETDLDALPTATVTSGRFDLRVTNEALETHLIKHVSVLAVPRPEGTQVVRAGERFFVAEQRVAPTSCTGLGGDCVDRLSRFDFDEYHTPTDPDDLATPETLELAFDNPGGELGVVIGARQSLVTTYVFYQALAWMGRTAGDFLAEFERNAGPLASASSLPLDVFDHIDVSVYNGAEWESAGRFRETGPIAREVQLITLPGDLATDEVRVRLTMAQGAWKVDRVGLAALGASVEPIEVSVRDVRDASGALEPEALALLQDSESYLVTRPGDVYTLGFELPAGDHALFLRSRGYYYEWIRKQWLAEEDPRELARLLLDPEGSLRQMAGPFKELEAGAEQIFWESRIGRPQ